MPQEHEVAGGENIDSGSKWISRPGKDQGEIDDRRLSHIIRSLSNVHSSGQAQPACVRRLQKLQKRFDEGRARVSKRGDEMPKDMTMLMKGEVSS